MINNIIYVEDGSVDVDELQDAVGTDTKIIIYRQGSTKPIVEQLQKPITNEFDEYLKKTRSKLFNIEWLCNTLKMLK